MTICATGHRPDKLWGYNLKEPRYKKLHDMCIEYFEKVKPDKIISGMDLGFDTVFVVAAIRYRDKHKERNVKVEAAIPCYGQERKWNTTDQNTYRLILSKVDIVGYTSETYSNDCMQLRNEYMVDHSDIVVALWNGDYTGGTYNTIRYAKSKRKKIQYISTNPLEFV